MNSGTNAVCWGLLGFVALVSGCAPGLATGPSAEVWVIPIRSEITEEMLKAVERQAAICRAGGTKTIIVDMDTFGGAAAPTLGISHLIRTDLKGIRTVCYVRSHAISGGALIALACDQLVMTDTGVLGDVKPVSVSDPWTPLEREKVLAVIREELRESARRNGYSIVLAENMVSGGEVWKLRHKTTGDIQYALAEDRDRLVQESWQPVGVVVRKGAGLVMSATEAKELGFASAVVPSDPDKPLANLMKHFGIAGEPTILSGD